VRDGAPQYHSGDWIAKWPASGSIPMAIPAPPESERTARRFRLAGTGSRGRRDQADDDAIVTELYRRYRTPLMSYVLG
jgi:hypothetical protein